MRLTDSKTPQKLTLKEFVEYGKMINSIYYDDEEEQAKAIGRYFDNVCREEGR